MDLTRETARIVEILRSDDRPSLLWRALDRVAPSRQAKVLFLSSILGFTTLGYMTVSLIDWINYARTSRLQVWSGIDKPSARLALIGISEQELLARFGTPASRTPELWVYDTGRREGPPLSGWGMESERVFVILTNRVVTEVQVTAPQQGHFNHRPFY